MDSVKEPLMSVFDFSFSEFITTKIVKILYGLAIFAAAFTVLSWIVSGFEFSVGLGLLTIVLSPVLFFLLVLTARIWLEGKAKFVMPSAKILTRDDTQKDIFLCNIGIDAITVGSP